MRYTYCPDCGTKLVMKQAGDDGLVPFCEPCGRYWFDNFFSCVIVLTYNEFDEVVVCRQSYISDTFATITAGYITPGETAEEAAFREVKEEIGLDLESLEYAGTTWFDKKGLLMHGFIGFCHKRDLQLSSEVDEAHWVPAREAERELFPDSPGNAAVAVLRRFLETRGLS